MPGLETGWEVRAGPGRGGPQAVKWDSRRPPRGAELEPERTPASDGRLPRCRHGGPAVPSRGRSLRHSGVHALGWRTAFKPRFSHNLLAA